ncbi:hypothetical protein [Mycolicibacterium septicum]|uniref:hypothetical protein n=1 Tax=Mycolicibacterium septicum TaxID=98668 RepID=UPI001AF6A2AB|nr:hypothetical protein [Mycolicibacterium septicum]QRY51810.1 hypothetical protein JVX95_31300 [Mycolicibacterium septicum]
MIEEIAAILREELKEQTCYYEYGPDDLMIDGSVDVIELAKALVEKLDLKEQWNLRWTKEGGDVHFGFVHAEKITGVNTDLYTHVHRYISDWKAET